MLSGQVYTATSAWQQRWLGHIFKGNEICEKAETKMRETAPEG